MTEEISIKFGCERCPKWTAVPTKAGVLGIVRKKPYPDNWSCINNVHLCPDCSKEYEALWADFLNKAKKPKVEA